MNRNQCSSLVAWTAFIISTFTGITRAEDVGPSKSVPELQALAHYVGSWDVTLLGADSNPTMKGEATAKWILDGRFVEQNSVMTGDDGARISIRTLYTFDTSKRAYQSWTFISTGEISEADATWDPKARTMTSMTRPGPEGTRTKIVADFSKADTETWTFLFLDRNGQQVSEIHGKNVRRTEIRK